MHFITDSELVAASTHAGPRAGQPETFDHLPYLYERLGGRYVCASLATIGATRLVLQRSPDTLMAPYYMGNVLSEADILAAGGAHARTMLESAK